MSEFLQKNKKKGPLALLLLLLKRSKGTAPLIAMVGLLATIFVVPTDVILGLPVVGPIAKKLGMRPPGISSGGSLALDDSRRADALRRGLNTPGALFGRDGARGAGADGGRRYGESTVDLVIGRDGAAGEAGGGAEDRGMVESGAELEGADALDPKDAEELDDALKLDNEDLIKSIGAEGGEGAEGFKPIAAFENLKGYKGLDNGGRIGTGARPLNPDDRNLLASALKNSNVPTMGQGRKLSNVKGGKLRGRNFRKLNAMVSSGMGQKRGHGGRTAMYQLAEGRAYSIASAPPPGKCDPGGGCPGEYAKNVAGTGFDGNEPAGGILTATELGENPTPNVPPQGEINALRDQANQVEEDARKCEEANEKYGPLIDAKNAEIDAQSQELNNTNCGGGGCSKSKYRACTEIEGRMKQTCRELNDLQRQWADACPLADGKYDEMKCTR